MKNLALSKPLISFPQGSTGGFLVPYMKLEVVGGSTLLEEEDCQYFSQWRWVRRKSGYVVRACRDGNRDYSRYLHREIMNPPEGMEVDHINGDKSDNRRSNLRVCSHAENSFNRKLNKNNRTGFKGVQFDKKKKKFRVIIGRQHLGYFSDPREAAIVYDKEAIKLFGEFARTNLLVSLDSGRVFV